MSLQSLVVTNTMLATNGLNCLGVRRREQIPVISIHNNQPIVNYSKTSYFN